jgi:hypothetical protein
MMKKAFPLGQVLSATTGRLLCEMGGLYEILNHMTGDTLWTHQLPRAFRECKPWMLRWFPELAMAEACLGKLDEWVAKAPTCPEEGVKMWLAELRMMFPQIKTEYEIDQIPRDDHDTKNPVDELVEMVGPDKVIVIETPEA